LFLEIVGNGKPIFMNCNSTRILSSCHKKLPAETQHLNYIWLWNHLLVMKFGG